MQVVVRADDGDEIAVVAHRFSTGDLVVRLELENSSYGYAEEFDWITLSPDRARQLAHALLMAIDGCGTMN